MRLRSSLAKQRLNGNLVRVEALLLFIDKLLDLAVELGVRFQSTGIDLRLVLGQPKDEALSILQTLLVCLNLSWRGSATRNGVFVVWGLAFVDENQLW